MKTEIPTEIKPIVNEIFDYLKIQNLRQAQYLQYLLFLKLNNWKKEAIGDGLATFAILPDDKISIDIKQLRQRLLYNLRCVDILSDFSKPIPDRIKDLPVEPNSIQNRITYLLKSENQIKSKGDICQAVLTKYPDLNFSNWAVPDFDTPHDLHVFVNKISSNEIRTQDGDLTLTIPRDKTVKVKIRISTKPAPKDFKELKSFRIVLMAIDGWYPVFDVKKTKVTENSRNYRDITMEFSETMVEEGS